MTPKSPIVFSENRKNALNAPKNDDLRTIVRKYALALPKTPLSLFLPDARSFVSVHSPTKASFQNVALE